MTPDQLANLLRQLLESMPDGLKQKMDAAEKAGALSGKYLAFIHGGRD